MLRHRSPQVSSHSLSSPTTLQFASASASANDEHVSHGKNSRYNSVGKQRSSSWTRSFDESSPLYGGWKHKLLLAVGFLLLAFPWIRHLSIHRKVSKLQEELTLLQDEQRQLQGRLRSQADTLKRVKADSDRHKKQNDALFLELKTHGDNFEDFDSEHYAAAEEMENAYFKRVNKLETEIQRSSERKLATDGFGILRSSEPIRVEITLMKEVSTFGNKLVMELGPVHFLAHAIELFLMLVEHKHFYDHLTLMHRSAGSSVINTVPMDSETMQVVSSDFVRNGHPIVGSPENSEPVTVQMEGDFMLHQLAMLEHTTDFPVVKYSVLFAEKGPHFYINMEDKPNVNLKESCFGKIVEGQAILDFMASHHEKNFRGMSIVGIKSVKVLKQAKELGVDARSPQTQRILNYKPKQEDLATASN